MMNILFLIFGVFLGLFIGMVYTGRFFLRQIDKIRNTQEKNRMLYHMANEWLMKKYEGKNIGEYLANFGYKKIAIYGMAYMGERLLDELKNSGIEVIYAIDQNADDIYSYVDVFKPEDDLENVDVVIVTSIAFFDEIKEKLSAKMHCPIVALDDIIYSL